MERWYTLHTKPHTEYQVAIALQRRGLEVYLPQLESPKTTPDSKGKPFFPCYLFLKVDFEIVGLSYVQWTPSLRRVLTFGDQPVPVSDVVIELIRRKLVEINANGGWPQHTFKSGDTVRITSGPFRDMLAIFEKPTAPGKRVQVLLTFLGHASRMLVQASELEEAPGKTEAHLPKSRRTRGHGRRIKGPSWQTP